MAISNEIIPTSDNGKIMSVSGGGVCDRYEPKCSEGFLLELYITSMTEKEHQAYIIAKSHLGSTFDLGKSLGFIKWKSEQREK